MPRPPRSGFHTVTPRIVVPDPAALVAFLRKVFGATGKAPPDRPAELRIGDSLVMVSSAGVRECFPAFLYVYVNDADTTYRRAIREGSISIEAPRDTEYGDRRAMVRDPFDNVWQIAHVTGVRRDGGGGKKTGRTSRRFRKSETRSPGRTTRAAWS